MVLTIWTLPGCRSKIWMCQGEFTANFLNAGFVPHEHFTTGTKYVRFFFLTVKTTSFSFIRIFYFRTFFKIQFCFWRGHNSKFFNSISNVEWYPSLDLDGGSGPGSQQMYNGLDFSTVISSFRSPC